MRPFSADVGSRPNAGVKYATVSELSGNQVLAQLPPRVRDRIAESLRRDVFKPWQLLRDAHQPITRIYFPIDCVISIAALMEDGSIAESYTTGRDGAAGSEIVWGGDRPIFRSMCQIPGVCYSMDAREFRAIAERDPAVMKADRRGLEEASCECYRVVADEFVRVLGGPVPALASSAP